MRPLKINVTIEDAKTHEILIVSGSLDILREVAGGVKIVLPKTSEETEPDPDLIEALDELFYIDPLNNEIWSSTNEIQNALRNLGTFSEPQIHARAIYRALKDFGLKAPRARRTDGEYMVRGYWGIQPKREG